MMKEELYKNATEADTVFQSALDHRFGPEADRFRHPKSRWDTRIWTAYNQKVRADNAWLNSMREEVNI